MQLQADHLSWKHVGNFGVHDHLNNFHQIRVFPEFEIGALFGPLSSCRAGWLAAGLHWTAVLGTHLLLETLAHKYDRDGLQGWVEILWLPKF